MKILRAFQSWVTINLVFLGISNCFIISSYSFDLVSQSSSQEDIPVVIEADGGITCDQVENWCEAHGNATAVKGEQTIKADKIRAYFEESSEKQTRKLTKAGISDSTLGKGLKRLAAEGKVEILSPRAHAWSDRGEYVAHSGCVKLTGEKVRLESAQQSIIADQEIEYCQPEGSLQAYAIAKGNAQAHKQDRVIQAETLKAYFKEKDALDKDSSSLEKVEAVGAVQIITSTTIARAKRGEYRAALEDVRLWGDVRITRGQSQLNGEYGYMNLKNGHAEILDADPSHSLPFENGSKTKKRVRALIIPNKKGDSKSAILSPSAQDVSE